MNAFKSFIIEDFEWKSYSFVVLFLTTLIAFNYSINFEDNYLDVSKNPLIGWLKYFLFYTLIYFVLLLSMRKSNNIKEALGNTSFYFSSLLFFGIIFLEKNIHLFDFFHPTSNLYFNSKVAYRLNDLAFLAIEFIILGLVLNGIREKGLGLWSFNSKLRIYVYFLLIMVPIVFLASLTKDFQNSYPQLNPRFFEHSQYTSYFMTYEPLYLLSFIRVEWLFRGFMILGLLPFLDKRTVLIMASIYCVFHLGNPLVNVLALSLVVTFWE